MSEKKPLIAALIFMIGVFILAGCFWGRAVEPTLEQVIFQYPLLESVIRENLNKQTGKITKEDMLLIIELETESRCTSKRLWAVRSLKGLEHATNLTVLRFDSDEVTDLTPLAGLINLTVLSFESSRITDLAPLAELTNLTELDLGGNRITDLAPLAELTNLTELDLGDNRITDLAPLAELTNLTELCLMDNRVTDLTPLAELINLTTLWLVRNRIVDIYPVLGLPNLLIFSVRENPLSEKAKQDLEVIREVTRDRIRDRRVGN